MDGLKAMGLRLLIAITLLAAPLAACEQGNKAGDGALVGAVAGGVIGNQFGSGGGRVAATAVGAVVGGIVGHEIGRSMDDADRRAAQEAEYRALEYGRVGSETPWRNSRSGHYGQVVPGQPYLAGNRHCRTYAHTIFIDGRPETLKGRACRQADGPWRNVG